jgi:hypothetical protein
MAVIQPYFDPTPARTTGLFAAFLEGFVAERSANNRAIMQQYLSMMSPKALREQQAIIMRTIGNLEDKKAGITRDAARGKSQERQAMLKGYLQVEVAKINARAGMSKVVFQSKTDLARTLLDNQAEANSELSKATGFTADNQLLAEISKESLKGPAEKYKNIASAINKDQKFSNDPRGKRAQQIAVLQATEQRLKMGGISPDAKDQTEALRDYTLRQLGADTTQDALEDFRSQYNLDMGAEDIRKAVDDISPEAFGAGGANIQKLMGILNEKGVSAEAPTKSIQDAIDDQWNEYSKLQTKIDEIGAKGATAMYEPFQWNYMLENLNTKEHRNQMLLDSVVEVGAPFGERTEMVRTTPEQIPDEPELLEESRAAQEDRESKILARFEAQRQAPQEPTQTRTIEMGLEDPAPTPAPTRRQPRAKTKSSTRRPDPPPAPAPTPTPAQSPASDTFLRSPEESTLGDSDLYLESDISEEPEEEVDLFPEQSMFYVVPEELEEMLNEKPQVRFLIEDGFESLEIGDPVSALEKFKKAQTLERSTIGARKPRTREELEKVPDYIMGLQLKAIEDIADLEKQEDQKLKRVSRPAYKVGSRDVGE